MEKKESVSKRIIHNPPEHNCEIDGCSWGLVEADTKLPTRKTSHMVIKCKVCGKELEFNR